MKSLLITCVTLALVGVLAASLAVGGEPVGVASGDPGVVAPGDPGAVVLGEPGEVAPGDPEGMEPGKQREMVSGAPIAAGTGALDGDVVGEKSAALAVETGESLGDRGSVPANEIGEVVAKKLPTAASIFSGDKGGVSSMWPRSYSVENTGEDCPTPVLPPFRELPSIKSLPNPFEWSNGSGTITRRSEWRCRRAEIAAEIQHYELGFKPAPPAVMESTYSEAEQTLRVKVYEGDSSLTLTAPIRIPTGDGPFPVIIGVGFGTGSLPPDIFTSRQVATVQFNFMEIGDVFTERGVGPFYDLYPTELGRYAGWAWGISRIIDGLERVGLNLDLSRIGVTGCSFAGKISLFAGAFDERIALTIAQEPGGGGAAAWRVTETLPGNRETLSKTTRAWFSPNLFQFERAVDKLPFDHHELMAMIAPRALLVLGNPDYEWMAEESAHVSSMAAKEVWTALGVPDRFGFSIVGGHGHCLLPDSQRPEVVAFVEKFLLGNEEAKTEISRSPYQSDLSRWITWETPSLD